MVRTMPPMLILGADICGEAGSDTVVGDGSITLLKVGDEFFLFLLVFRHCASVLVSGNVSVTPLDRSVI